MNKKEFYDELIKMIEECTETDQNPLLNIEHESFTFRMAVPYFKIDLNDTGIECKTMYIKLNDNYKYDVTISGELEDFCELFVYAEDVTIVFSYYLNN